jgi:hypothetical protein
VDFVIELGLAGGDPGTDPKESDEEGEHSEQRK